MQQTRTPPQTIQILNYLLSGNSITPIEALNLFGCFRLASRIKDLRYNGWNIKTEKIGKSGFAKYSIEK